MIVGSFEHWCERVRAGSKPELGEALSVVERGGEPAVRLLSRLHRLTGAAHVIGVTGAPGSGKSTLVNALALHLAERGHRVGVIAVDPSSPFSGGALLGDRVRMGRASGHPRIFIRSAATRCSLGGLARTTHQFVRVFDAAGYDPIIVETVGVGQSEVDIWKVAHTPIVVEVPGLGDEVQTMKAGVLEIAAIFCLNKADLEGAEARLRQMRDLARHAREHSGGWKLPVVPVVAQSGAGVDSLAEAIAEHAAWLGRDGRRQRMERERATAELRTLLEAELVDRPLAAARAGGTLDALVDAILARQMSPAAAAGEFIRSLLPELAEREIPQ